jgi:hypothetical protein
VQVINLKSKAYVESAFIVEKDTEEDTDENSDKNNNFEKFRAKSVPSAGVIDKTDTHQLTF